jgi:hypothetical protein
MLGRGLTKRYPSHRHEPMVNQGSRMVHIDGEVKVSKLAIITLNHIIINNILSNNENFKRISGGADKENWLTKSRQ